MSIDILNLYFTLSKKTKNKNLIDLFSIQKPHRQFIFVLQNIITTKNIFIYTTGFLLNKANIKSKSMKRSFKAFEVPILHFKNEILNKFENIFLLKITNFSFHVKTLLDRLFYFEIIKPQYIIFTHHYLINAKSRKRIKKRVLRRLIRQFKKEA